MISLDEDIQKPKQNFYEFADLSLRIINYLPNIINKKQQKDDYLIFSSNIAGNEKFTRPINSNLIILDEKEFIIKYDQIGAIFDKIRSNITEFTKTEKLIIDRTIYTIAQLIGVGLDLLVNPNSARKHVGNRFEELIRCVFCEIGISNKKIVLQIPYESDGGLKTYKCENDLIISPYDKVRSTQKHLDKNEVVLSVKTTSKDRIGKMFIDKILLERFVEHPQKVVGIFLNDVQRKESNNVSYTLVSGLFMVYTKFLVKLEGIYYLDPPPNALKEPFNHYMKPFSSLLTEDLSKLFTS